MKPYKFKVGDLVKWESGESLSTSRNVIYNKFNIGLILERRNDFPIGFNIKGNKCKINGYKVLWLVTGKGITTNTSESCLELFNTDKRR